MAQPLDRWAAWQLEQQQWLVGPGPNPMRDRVLAGARLEAGQRVLDIGAGIGMLALEARRRVGPSGLVVALDRSPDSLAACLRFAAEEEAAPVAAIISDACRLPFPEQTFEAVVLRSVLIYVAAKAAALAECHRVLRPGGRLSLFEPINRVSAEPTPTWQPEFADLAERDRRIRHYQEERQEQREEMLGFDERDLLRDASAAGFATVELTYEYYYAAAEPIALEQLAANLHRRPAPTIPSYAEAAEAILGEAAGEHLTSLVSARAAHPGPRTGAVAYLRARRATVPGSDAR